MPDSHVAMRAEASRKKPGRHIRTFRETIAFGYEVASAMRFKLRQMEVFRAVMLTGSMTAAAKLLLVSQPSVSRLIAYTEQSLGLRLFDRQRGKLVPTTEAELLFHEVERLYENALQVDEFAAELRDNPRGVLSIAVSPSLAIDFVPGILADFRRAYPDTLIQMRTTLLADMARELLGRQVNLAVSVMPIADPGLVVEPFAVGRMVCIAPPDHPIGVHEVLDLSVIATHPMVIYNRGIPFGGLIWGAFERAGLRPTVAVEIARAELAFALVRQRIGVAIVDEFSVNSPTTADLLVRPLSERIPVTLSLMRSAFEKPNLQTRNFLRMVKAHTRTRGLGLAN
ncbi:MAG: LysR family transcriptional regulator [Rhizobiaceae bacterium]|nr:LysR family transcriptional regulator [Rhizobiaceae bacterium]